jgi:hypothetical protein
MGEKDNLEGKTIPTKVADRCGESWVLLELTEGQRDGLERVPILDRNGRKIGVSEDIYYNHGLEYIDGSKAIGYFSHEQQKKFQGAPSFKVQVDFQSKWRESRAGDYWFEVPLLPEKQKDESGSANEILMVGYVLPKDVLEKRVDPKYIVKDDSGLIVPITEERILSVISQAIEETDKGQRGIKNLNYAGELAKVGGFWGSLLIKIEDARKYDSRKYLERYSSPENLDKVLSSLEGKNEGLFYEEEWGWSDESELFPELLEVIKEINFPDEELKKRAVNVLRERAKIYRETAKMDRDKIKKFIKENIGFVRELEADAKDLEFLSDQLLGQALISFLKK